MKTKLEMIVGNWNEKFIIFYGRIAIGMDVVP